MITPVWNGFCGTCGAPITRNKVPPPCHEKRMNCAACTKQVRINARANWRASHPEAERLHRRRVGRRRTERVRAESRELAEATGTKWTGEEEAFLMRNINVIPQREIALRLGRSMSSVEVKLWRLRSIDRAR